MAEMCLSLPTINEESRGIAFPHLNEILVHGNFTCCEILGVKRLRQQ